MIHEIVFILDRSGSMRGSEDDTIGGYNAFLAKQQKEEGNAVVTTALFDHEYSLLHDWVDLRQVRPITHEEYSVRGRTALLDAVGYTIAKVTERAADTVDHDGAVFVIITDGRENASREYTHEQVHAMIEERQQRGWEFIFLGADLSNSIDARRMGIRDDRQGYFSKKSTSTVFDAMSDNISTFRKTKQMPNEWDAKFTGERSRVNNSKDSIPHIGSSELVTVETHWGKAVINTGSPSSFGVIPYFNICGRRHAIVRNPLMPEIQRHLGFDIVAIIGMDILSEYNLTIEHNETTGSFEASLSKDPFTIQRTEIPLQYVMGIPVTQITVNGITAPFFLDTASAITYVGSDLVRGLLQLGSKKDFYPGIGTFEAQTYAAHTAVFGTNSVVIVGVLPKKLEHLLQHGIKGILGIDVLKQFRCMLGFRSGKYHVEARLAASKGL